MHVMPHFDFLEGTERLLDILVEFHQHFLFLFSAFGQLSVSVMTLNPRGGLWVSELTYFRRLLRLVENKIAALRVRVVHGHGRLLTNWIISLSGLVRVRSWLDSDLTISTADSQDWRRCLRERFALSGCTTTTNSSLIDVLVIQVLLTLLLAYWLSLLFELLDFENVLNVFNDGMAVFEKLI